MKKVKILNLALLLILAALLSAGCAKKPAAPKHGPAGEARGSRHH